MTTITADELGRFGALVADRMGLVLDLQRDAASIQSVLRARLRETQAAGVDEYLQRVTALELAELAQKLTVGETYFFRYREQFEALAEHLPELAKRAGRSLRILSAACSSGEEAGSIAIVVRQVLPDALAGATVVHGADVNPDAIRKARRGRYSRWSLRETSETITSRWFHRRGADYELDVAARSLTSFMERNLNDPNDKLWQAEPYDAIFCRNALMYFGGGTAGAAVARLARLLVPGGLLFLGPTETHLGKLAGLSVCSSHGAFYHRLSSAAALDPEVPAKSARLSSKPAPVSVEREPWTQTVQVAAAKIAELARERRDEPARREPTPAPKPELNSDLARARQLAAEGRQGEALAAISDRDRDPSALLLRGMLLVDTGNSPEAERCCGILLELDRERGIGDEIHAGARYVLALCREQLGDTVGAIDHDHAAVYLAPSFAMPHVHIGLMSRRRGDVATAVREFRSAVSLLAEEDATRIALYGGGLRREALIELCRRELQGCGQAA